MSIHCRHLSSWIILTLIVSTFQPARSAEPDFSDVSDILLGERHLLRTEDLLITLDTGNQSTGSQFKNLHLNTKNLHINQQTSHPVINPKCHLTRPDNLSHSVPFNNVIHSRLGRLFDLDHDVSVTLAPAASNYGQGCHGLLGLYIKDPADSANNSLTVVENSSPMWTQLLLADFDQDGFDDVFQNHGGGYAIHTASHLQKPADGLKRVAFQGIPGDVSALLSPPVAGDFNGDGAMDIAWLASQPKDNSPISIYLISVCPRPGVEINGNTCQRPFQVIPVSSVDYAQQAIDTGARLNWPSPGCSGCPDSMNQFALAAGNFDGRFTAMSGTHRDELVFVRSDQWQLEVTAYRLGVDLKPQEPPKKTVFKDFKSHGFHLTSGPIQPFSTLDQLALISVDDNINVHNQLAVIRFASDLQASWHVLDTSAAVFNRPGTVYGYAIANGIAMGRFDPPQQGGDRDSHSQVAVLYDVRNDAPVPNERFTVVHIYTLGGVADPAPKFKSEYVAAKQLFTSPGIMSVAAPLQAGDIQGRTLLLGEPDTFQVESHLQPNVILGSPPQHVDFITPAKQHQPVVFNFSAIKKDFHSTYAVQSSNENQSSNRSTTSSGWALKQSSSLAGKTNFGVVEVSGELRQSLDVAEKNSVGKTFDTFQSKSFDASTTTGLGDQLWYSSRRMNVFIYPVLGKYRCPDDRDSCEIDEREPMTVVFSGPDNIRANISATGRNLEWYQPVHVPGQLFTYPWNQQQLLLQNPDLQTLSQTNTGAFFTDDSSTTRKINWKGSSKSSQSVGFSSSWTLGGGTSVAVGTPEETYKKAGGVKGAFNFDMSYSHGLESLNTDSSQIGTSTGIAIKKPGSFPNPGNYQFLLEPFVFGSDDQIQRSGNLKPDGDILTRGPLQTAFTADPTDPNSGSWWSSSPYRQHSDVGFGFPARWEIGNSNQTDLIDKATACIGGECAVMDNPDSSDLWNSSFFWLRGFYIRANGEGPQRTAAHSGDRLQLSVRVYNHSLKDMNQGQRIKVRFFGQPWNHQTNQPLAGSTSFLIGEDNLPALPGFASSEDPNWRMAHTWFDTTRCGGQACGGNYYVFWAVVWTVDGQQQLVRQELPGHGLNQDMETTELNTLLSQQTPEMQRLFTVADHGLMEQTLTQDKVTTSFSNNLGFYHQVFFIHNHDLPAWQSKRAASSNHAQTQGQAGIRSMRLAQNNITAGQEVTVTIELSSQGHSNDALQLMLYQHGPDQSAGQLLDHEIITHIKANDRYQVRLPIRPEGCGNQRIQAVLNPGEPSQAPELMASATLTIACD
jgi:hypothetical protein